MKDKDTLVTSNTEEEEEVEEVSDDSDDESEDFSIQQQSIIDPALKNLEISESGTIANIEVVNFMCHKYLKMAFGPKINFVIGHNGSGKSAILTALTVALGAKANSTNRGKNLSALIREGANAALVTIHITNKGSDSFKNDVYGDIIIVDRRILRDGSSSFKIKNYLGKTISTKREELTAICDHMSIQVDNPLTMLSQDSARQFLNSSTPHDKYKLFMRGTQLAQMQDDFRKIRETLEITDTTISRKNEHLPLLHRKAREAELVYKELLSANTLDEQIDQLNNELVWSQIITKEKELANVNKHIEESQKLLDNANEKINGTKLKINRFEDEIAGINEQILEYQSNNEPDSQLRSQLENQKLTLDTKLLEVKDDMLDTNKQFKLFREQIATATAKLESDNHLENKKITLTNRSQELAKELDEITLKHQDLNKKQDELKEIDTKQNLQRLRAQKENEALQDIANERRWKGRPPVGPFEVMEILLETFEDQALLRRILQRHELGKCNIMVAKRDFFDFSHDEPNADYLTILRAIDFDDEYVKRQLIISNNIHQILLMANRAEAEEVMNAAYTSDCQSVGAVSGMRTESLRRHRDIRLKKNEQLQTIGEKAQVIKEEMVSTERESRQLFTTISEHKASMRKMETQINKATQDINNLKESLKEDEPANLSILEEDKEECIQRIQHHTGVFKSLKNSKMELKSSLEKVMTELAELDDKEERDLRKINSYRDEIQKTEALMQKQKEQLTKLEEQYKLHEMRNQAHLQSKSSLEKTIQDWTNQAMVDYPVRVETTQSLETIQRKIAHLEKQIEEKENQAGISLEEAEALAKKAATEFKEVKETIEEMKAFSKKMNESLLKRMQRWNAFRMYMSLAAKGHFNYYIHKRGDNGTLKFNHKKETLDVRVATGDQFSEGANRRKDSKSLSGGEKSFSQISLLLSLWQGISSPILCLDEFDVYMDAVNRKQSMKMMMLVIWYQVHMLQFIVWLIQNDINNF
ncbi:P-loop containing nucleoside triphosphate hydrolase protein [Cunninghamella echinulata]|nr:P-loop containing nucleoside triphosphate hydrolase protein [Cunninghamella echinulata]